jgi:hypothetical protein
MIVVDFCQPLVISILLLILVLSRVLAALTTTITQLWFAIILVVLIHADPCGRIIYGYCTKVVL